MTDDGREHVEASVVVERDRHAVYERWARFEDFPAFMEGVEAVERSGPTRLRWTASVYVQRTWEAEVVEDVPGKVIAWRADGDVAHDGRVSFQELSPGRTQVTVRMDYSPDGFVDAVGARLGLVHRWVLGDLERFKALVEAEAVRPPVSER